jgi:hypothetical protein
MVILGAAMVQAAPHSQYMRVLDITIRVENVEDTLEDIRRLAGQNLTSSVQLGEQGFSWAHFERRVPAAAMQQTMQTLRGLGEVLGENESTFYLGREIRDLEARLAANSLEIQRLLILMGNAANLNILMTIDGNLARAERERDDLIGRLNYLNNTAGQPYIIIHLAEVSPIMPLRVDEPAPTFWQRLGNSFTGSVSVIVAAFEYFVVFLTLAALPLGLLAVAGWLIYILIRRLTRPKVLATAPMAVPAAPVAVPAAAFTAAAEIPQSEIPQNSEEIPQNSAEMQQNSEEIPQNSENEEDVR